MKILERQGILAGKARSQTLKQILRALGNSSLILQNARDIVRMRYQGHMLNILNKLDYSN